MNLSIFFEPVNEELAAINGTYTFGALVHCFTSKFPDWRHAQIALIGVNEWRGSLAEPPEETPADVIRRHLFSLKQGTTADLTIIDMGNLRPGLEVEDTYLRLKEICEMLIDHQTIPVIIGGSHDLDYGQFMAYEHLDRVINMVSVDSRFDMEPDEDLGGNQHRFHKILMHEPNFLFSFSQIGYQRYFVDPEMLAALEKMHFETIRLGDVHAQPEETEPVIRNADMLTFDISAIKMQDAPASSHTAPFGLTGEQACQLCWYAGTNDKLSSFGIYEYNPALDNRDQTAVIVATMIWYFVEGYAHRKNETEFDKKRFVKYAVSFNDNPHKMHFYKSRQTDKWWLEVPHHSDDQPATIVPCSYQDYLLATKGEIPNRWMVTQARMG